MPMPYLTTGVPTTNIWDVQEIQNIDVNSPRFKELLIRLYQNINNISNLINIKDSAYYDVNEILNGQQFFPNPNLSTQVGTQQAYRAVIRKTINFGGLPNAGTTSIAHNIAINSQYSFTRIYGVASDQTNKVFIPIPYASPTLNKNIEINVDATNVNITTGIDRTSFTICYVVLEYMNL